MPAFASFLFNYFQLFFLLFLVVSAATFASAIGLLKRKNWARILFVGIMGLGILWNVVGIVFMALFFQSMPPVSAGAPSAGAGNFEVMWTIMLGFNLLMVAGFVWLFGWIIKRLLSEEVRREFSAA
jgi:hypothetical protein